MVFEESNFYVLQIVPLCANCAIIWIRKGSLLICAMLSFMCIHAILRQQFYALWSLFICIIQIICIMQINVCMGILMILFLLSLYHPLLGVMYCTKEVHRNIPVWIKCVNVRFINKQDRKVYIFVELCDKWHHLTCLRLTLFKKNKVTVSRFQ